jgi:hypothetical protein
MYPLATSRRSHTVDFRTLHGVAYSLQNACFSCLCSPNDEDSEHSFLEGVILLRSHSDVFVIRLGRATKCA